jgi:hypothetical protein
MPVERQSARTNAKWTDRGLPGQFGLEGFCVNGDTGVFFPRPRVQSYQPGHKVILGFVGSALKDLGNARTVPQRIGPGLSAGALLAT